MGGTNAQLLIGQQVSLPGHFALPVTLEANIVHETVALKAILDQVSAIEEARVEEALANLTTLLRTAIKDARAKHPAGKGARILFTLDEPPASE